MQKNNKGHFLINASNLHFGGGVQVASSFIYELSLLLKVENLNVITVFCSKKVRDSLPFDFDDSVFKEFEVIDVFGKSRPTKSLQKKFNGYDVCFTVFGPFYFSPKVKKHICGFAQPWIAYPKNDVYKRLSLLEFLKNKIKFKIQSFFFRRFDLLIVEQKHIKNALCKLNYKPDEIRVVSNCVSSIYEDKTQWLPISFDKGNLVNEVTLGFIGRPYPHKNVAILNEVYDILVNKFNMRCNFVFTFTKEEMELCEFEGNRDFHTVGEIVAAQCPSFYKLLDALVFPSLLECFSASPIEAMKMNTTVIASDYPFVREICDDSIFYFNPLDAFDIAAQIHSTFSDNLNRLEKVKLASELVGNLPTSKNRAISYLNIIQNSI